MSDRDEPMVAGVRLAAGALFTRGEEVLLVHPTNKSGWEIPGGPVAPGESPTVACRREIREELDLDRPPQRLLVHDWASLPAGDRIIYVFDCGELGDDSFIQLRTTELDRWQWVRVDTVDSFARPALARQIWHAFRAYLEGRPLFLEHGDPALAQPTTDVAIPSWLDRQADRDRHLG